MEDQENMLTHVTGILLTDPDVKWKFIAVTKYMLGGTSVTDIAKEVGKSRATVSTYLNREDMNETIVSVKKYLKENGKLV